MRVRDIAIGHTYVVLIPQRIPKARYPDSDQPGTPAWAWWWMHGVRFRITVTDVDTTTDPVQVEGLRITERPHIEVTLTDEQVTALGLPEGDYHVRGLLYDGRDRLVGLPEVEPLRVPVRWLRPENVDDRTHRDIDRYPYM